MSAALQHKKQHTPPKAVVKVPRFVRRQVVDDVQPSKGGRRAQQSILEKLEEDRLALLMSQPPPPKGEFYPLFMLGTMFIAM